MVYNVGAYIPLWYDMKVNPKGLSAQILLRVSPRDVETSLMGMILNLSYEGVWSLQGIKRVISLSHCDQI